MVMTASSIQAGFEPIPGYVLRDKLGAGGYGEVWLADAPGGLKKAIKFVHGNIEGNRASGELKSLQRVRQVNHPFILSLERIEVVEGQLIIVTELAQCSLHDRFIEFQQKGFVGIMRERLIGYMRDSAEGLDFLCQQHDLQHLDVKPANLLLVADRVKIADFGLIKDIESNSLSVMGGLTPTYAAPEMFDGRPGRFSDQYSLAIVYQELLTGTFPFRGRTTAQLANEHLNKAPNLEAIPLLERPILAKALAKRPQMRYSDSREFIAALERAHSQAAPIQPTENPLSSQIKKRPNKALSRSNHLHSPVQPQHVSSSSLSTQSQISPVTSVRGVEVLHMLAEIRDLPNEVVGSELNTHSKKCFVIGLGATGAHALMGMRERMVETQPDSLDCEQFGFLLIDSDQKTVESALDLDKKERLPHHATLLMPLKSPQYYRENTKSNFRQLSRRWLYNIPRSLKTEGVRPLGMLAFLDNATRVFYSLQESILEIAKSNGDDAAGEPIHVQIISSAHGGTGGVIAPEIGFMVRQIAADLEAPIRIEMILTCASPNGFASSDLTTASALACLTEINHYFQTEGLHSPIDQIPESTAINQPPFDHVTLIYGGQCGNSEDWEEAIKQASHYAWVYNCSELGERIEKTKNESNSNAREDSSHDWTEWLNTVNSRNVEIATHIEPEEAANRLCLQKSLQWLNALNDPRLDGSQRMEHIEAIDPKLLEKMDFFVGDMFRSNHWTAQAWVRECMNCLVSSSVDPESESDSTAAQTPDECDLPKPNSSLNLEQLRDLEQLCEQLAVDVQCATHSISSMLTTTQQKLGEWLISRWFIGPIEIIHLRDIVRLIGTKFSVNANSLHVVSQKLCDNHDALLERLYSGEQKSTPEQDKQLQTTALEARFHSLGAKMLARLASHMSHLEDLWLNECKLICSELSKWVDELSNRLGICFDNSSKSNSLLSALLQSECDDAINKEIRRSFQSIIGAKLMSTLQECVDPSIENDDKPTSFQEVLVSSTLLLTTQHSVASKPRDSQETRTGQTSAMEASKTISVEELDPANVINTKNPKENNVDSGTLAKRSLEMEIDSSRPYLVEFGGAVRNVVLVPNQLMAQVDSLQKATLEGRKVATISSDRFRNTTLVSLGEQLVLSDIIERVWMPSSNIWHLANRILARVDVDWVAIYAEST